VRKKINNRDRRDFFRLFKSFNRPGTNRRKSAWRCVSGASPTYRCDTYLTLRKSLAIANKPERKSSRATYRHREQQQQQRRRGVGKEPTVKHPCTMWCVHRSHTHTTSCIRTYIRSCVPRVITGFRRGNAPAMADPPAYSRGKFQAFGHSGDATGTHGVFPSHRWFQRQLNTGLSRRPGAVREARGARRHRRRQHAARFPAIRSLSHAMRYRALLLRVIATHAMAVLRERGRNLRGKRTRDERIANA